MGGECSQEVPEGVQVKGWDNWDWRVHSAGRKALEHTVPLNWLSGGEGSYMSFKSRGCKLLPVGQLHRNHYRGQWTWDNSFFPFFFLRQFSEIITCSLQVLWKAQVLKEEAQRRVSLGKYTPRLFSLPSLRSLLWIPVFPLLCSSSGFLWVWQLQPHP